MILPLMLVGSGIAALVYVATREPPVPDFQPDLPPSPMVPGTSMPASTRYRLVDAILPDLKKASASSQIPLGLLVGWIAKESGGRLGEVTKLDERGYFQLMPDESKAIGYDHQRLSTDSIYSINAGLALIGKYMGSVDRLGLTTAVKGSPFFFKMVKLIHTVGSGDTKKIVDGALAAGKAGSWKDFEEYALSGAAKTNHSPAKWFPLVDKVYEVGAPFGFGDQPDIVGAALFSDIPDPLDVVAPQFVY